MDLLDRHLLSVFTFEQYLTADMSTVRWLSAGQSSRTFDAFHDLKSGIDQRHDLERDWTGSFVEVPLKRLRFLDGVERLGLS